VISVDKKMVMSNTGKNMLRAKKEPITVSAPQNMIIAPSEPVYLSFNKKTGMAGKPCTGSITVNKACFLPGEDIHLQVSTDNTACADPCELRIQYVCKAKFRQSGKTGSYSIISKDLGSFGLVNAHQSVENFQLAVWLPREIAEQLPPPSI
jgi:hypothetical protein